MYQGKLGTSYAEVWRVSIRGSSEGGTSDKTSVGSDPAQERRAQGGLERQADKEKACNALRLAALVPRAPALVADGQLDPGIVRAEAGCPDHTGDIEELSVIKNRPAAVHARHPRDATYACVGDVFGSCADEGRPARRGHRSDLASDRGVNAQEPADKPPVGLSAKDFSQDIGRDAADIPAGEPDPAPRTGKLDGNFSPGVTRAHHENGALGELAWVPVRAGMELNDARIELGCEGRNERLLVRPCRHDDPRCKKTIGSSGEVESIVRANERVDLRAVPNGPLQLFRRSAPGIGRPHPSSGKRSRPPGTSCRAGC